MVKKSITTMAARVAEITPVWMAVIVNLFTKLKAQESAGMT